MVLPKNKKKYRYNKKDIFAKVDLDLHNRIIIECDRLNLTIPAFMRKLIEEYFASMNISDDELDVLNALYNLERGLLKLKDADKMNFYMFGMQI